MIHEPSFPAQQDIDPEVAVPRPRPDAGRYVVGQDGVIAYAEVDPD